MRVLIVEDEYLVRVGLRSSIDWEGNGFTLLDDATNGEEALKSIQEEQPDIVLLDIQIPQIDGIELLKYIRQQKYNCKVIIISCHDDFSLVREALRLGAVDYLRKLSIKPSEILEVLHTIQSSSDLPSNESAEGPNDTQMLDDHLLNIAMGDKEGPGTGSRLDSGYSLFIDVDNPRKHFYTFKANVFTNLLRQSIKSLGKDCCICAYNDAAFYVAILGRPMETGVAEKVRGQVLNTTGISLSIGTGPAWEDISGIGNSFEAAKNIIYDKFYQGCGLVRVYSEGVYPAPPSSPGFLQLYRDITRLFEIKKHSEIVGRITDAFQDMRTTRKYYPDMIKVACIEVFNIITRNLPSNSFESEKLNIFRTIMSSGTIDELEEYFIEQIRQVVIEADLNHSHSSSPIMKNALKYISENIYADISLSQLSRAVNVSESYLSMLFHKETGENCIAYINKQKIDIAKQMLQENNLIYEVAERLGFESSSYFSKVFKKYVGVTPEQYRGKT